jgi:hypothetical protein
VALGRGRVCLRARVLLPAFCGASGLSVLGDEQGGSLSQVSETQVLHSIFHKVLAGVASCPDWSCPPPPMAAFEPCCSLTEKRDWVTKGFVWLVVSVAPFPPTRPVLSVEVAKPNLTWLCGGSMGAAGCTSPMSSFSHCMALPSCRCLGKCECLPKHMGFLE